MASGKWVLLVIETQDPISEMSLALKHNSKDWPLKIFPLQNIVDDGDDRVPHGPKHIFSSSDTCYLHQNAFRTVSCLQLTYTMKNSYIKSVAGNCNESTQNYTYISLTIIAPKKLQALLNRM